MNPPFKGTIITNYGNKKYWMTSKDYYLFHLIKAISLPMKNEKLIFIICPFLNFNEKSEPVFNLYDFKNQEKLKIYPLKEIVEIEKGKLGVQ